MLKKNFSLLITMFTVGLLIPLSANAISFSSPTTPTTSPFIGANSYDHESTEDSREVDPIVTPSTEEAENTCMPVTHTHWHINESNNTDEQYFRAAVYATAIAFDDEFIDNIKTDNEFYCSNGNSVWVDCSFDKSTDLGDIIYDSNSDTSNTDEWNGTTITYETLSWIDGDPVGLVWRYGQDDPTDITLLPWLDKDQSKGESINFEPEDYSITNEATTASWTKLMDSPLL